MKHLTCLVLMFVGGIVTLVMLTVVDSDVPDPVLQQQFNLGAHPSDPSR